MEKLLTQSSLNICSQNNLIYEHIYYKYPRRLVPALNEITDSDNPPWRASPSLGIRVGIGWRLGSLVGKGVEGGERGSCN